MRARIRYAAVLSPRAPQRYAGYVAGLVLSALGVAAAILGGMAATAVVTAYCSVIVSVAA